MDLIVSHLVETKGSEPLEVVEVSTEGSGLELSSGLRLLELWDELLADGKSVGRLDALLAWLAESAEHDVVDWDDAAWDLWAFNLDSLDVQDVGDDGEFTLVSSSVNENQTAVFNESVVLHNAGSGNRACKH